MNFDDVVVSRRSIRRFRSDKISRDILDKIIYHATMAPSGKHEQPWYFVVIQDDVDYKNKVADLIVGAGEEQLVKNPNFPQGYVRGTALAIKTAPVLIAVFETRDSQLNMQKQSMGAAIQNICLSATAAGLGSLWMGYVDLCNKEIESHLGVPSTHKIVAAVAIGYSDMTPAVPPRKPLDATVEFR